MTSPRDYLWGAGEQPIAYDLRMDPRQKGNSIRYWVHWLETDNKRVLEMPPVYGDSRIVQGFTTAAKIRRQSEVDDNGEAYPLTKEGPDIYASLQIPPGLYTLSFYNHNKDGHDGQNRMRDYKISIRPRPANLPLQEVGDFEKWPEAARSRQRDFWGGVYQKFLVRGPQSLTVKFAKNNSFNTILAGIFLDEVNLEPAPYFRQAKVELADVEPQMENAALVSQLWNALEKAKANNPAWWASEARRIYAPLVRWHEAARLKTTSAGLPRLYSRMGTSYAALNFYPQWEATQRQRGLTPAREIEKALRWDKETIALNGREGFSGRGRRTVRGYLFRPETTTISQPTIESINSPVRIRQPIAEC